MLGRNPRIGCLERRFITKVLKLVDFYSVNHLEVDLYMPIRLGGIIEYHYLVYRKLPCSSPYHASARYSQFLEYLDRVAELRDVTCFA